MDCATASPPGGRRDDQGHLLERLNDRAKAARTIHYVASLNDACGARALEAVRQLSYDSFGLSLVLERIAQPTGRVTHCADWVPRVTWHHSSHAPYLALPGRTYPY